MELWGGENKEESFGSHAGVGKVRLGLPNCLERFIAVETVQFFLFLF